MVQKRRFLSDSIFLLITRIVLIGYAQSSMEIPDGHKGSAWHTWK